MYVYICSVCTTALLEVGCDATAKLEERDLAELGVVLGYEDALFGIEEALLGFAHLNT